MLDLFRKTGGPLKDETLTFYPEHKPGRSPVQLGAPVHLLKLIREELDDHRVTINQNTEEIQANHEAVYQLSQKLDKLHEMLEELRGKLGTSNGSEPQRVEPMTLREQEVFLLLYTANGFISEREVSERLGVSDKSVVQFITTLMEKGVPITRKVHYQESYVKLDQQFKELQAKANIAGISPQLTLALSTRGALQ
ncbi:HTH domain-containing protein [Candidatus Woesearchaeota archaeon]|nr:HTH domain-containing protein [Candidatus Woesearchaeota archaeon]